MAAPLIDAVRADATAAEQSRFFISFIPTMALNRKALCHGRCGRPFGIAAMTAKEGRG